MELKMKTENSSSRRTQYLATIVVALGTLAAGTSTAWSSPAYKPLVHESVMGFPISDEEFNLIGSTYTIGATFFCVPAGLLANRLGLQKVMLLLVLPSLLGWYFIIWASSIFMIYLGRFILGAASGCILFIVPIYIGEIAQTDIRGELSGYSAFLNAVGFIVTYVLGAFLPLQSMSFICMVIIVVYGFLLCWQPESPRFLVKKDDLIAAEKSLKYFRGENYNISDELQEMIRYFKENQSKTGSIYEALQIPSSRKAILLCMVLLISLQGTGIAAMVLYTEVIFEQSNLPINSSYVVIFTGSVLALFTFIASKIVDRCGRRMLLIPSSVAIVISNLTMSIYFSLDTSTARSVSFIPILSTCVFFAMFAVGPGFIPWTIMAEILPEEIKNVVGSSATMLSWLLASINALYFNRLCKLIGISWGFLIFSVISCLCLIYNYLFLPETKCLSPEEIQIILGKKKVNADDFYLNSGDKGTVSTLT